MRVGLFLEQSPNMNIVTGQIPQFEILEELGEGATSRVFKAKKWDSNFTTYQVVALKVLKSRNKIRYLKQEFDKLKNLRSPHCVQIFSWEELDIGTALVLEFIEGVSLYNIGKGGALLTSDAQQLVLYQVYRGLKDLEAQGLYHGDLTPRNIMIDRQGQVRLLDLGSFFSDSEIFANPDYLHPDLVRTRTPNFRSDFYALAIIYYQLVQGQWSYRATAEQVSKKGLRNLVDQIESVKEEVLNKGQAFLSKEVSTHLSDEFLTQRLLVKDLSSQKTSLPMFSVPFDQLKSEGWWSAWVSVAQQWVAKWMSWSVGRSAFSNFSGLLTLSRLRSRFALSVEKAFGAMTPVYKEVRQFLISLGWLLLFYVTFFLIPILIAPKKTKSVTGWSQLDVRSQSWVKVSLNGLPFRYTPVRFENLRPGRYTLYWESPYGKGKREVVLKAHKGLKLQL